MFSTWVFTLGVLTVGQNPASGASQPLSIESYSQPPKEIASAVLAPWHKNRSITNLSPSREYCLVTEQTRLTPLAYLAKPYLNLGGVMLDPNGLRARRYNMRHPNGIYVRELATNEERMLQLPEGMYATDPTWSPDGTKIACFLHEDAKTWIGVADAKTLQVKKLGKTQIMPTMATEFDWTGDSKSIFATAVPLPFSPMPLTPQVPVSPRVRVSDDKVNRLRTYRSLLDGPTDAAIFEYLATTQLVRLDVNSGNATPIGKPAMITGFNPAPDGKFTRVTIMQKPFSYIVPVSSFGSREVLWDETGAEKTEISKRALSLGDAPPTPVAPTGPTGPRGPGAPLGPGGRRTGGGDQPTNENKRELSWRPDGAGLSFLQLEPRQRGQSAPAEGAPPAPRKDRVMLWKAPYGEKDMDVVWSSEKPISNVRYSVDMKTLFVDMTNAGKRQTVAVRLNEDGKTYVISEASEDFYANPGDLQMRAGALGISVVRMSKDQNSVYLSGTQYDKNPRQNAPKPFIDKVEIATGKKSRIFESKPDVFEQATIMDDDATKLLVNSQSANQYPNAHLLTVANSSKQAVTANRDPVPDLGLARREWIQVTRPDGFKFWVKVTLPEYYVPGAKMPAMFWFYPDEVTDQAAYDQSKRTFNKNTYEALGPNSWDIVLRAGYVLVEPDCPIVGPSTRMNDLYIPQLRNNLGAVIDELDRRGYIDRTRLAIGGHSYGGFSTANAMVHTPYFKAGISGAGNYNRSLTPFGFQAESRQIWEAREMYMDLSSILYLEQITGAILLYHGMDDQNIGTDPINSVRMFQALEALGKPAALYMYPFEDHGQVATETVLDQWARWIAWLDKWVKNANKPKEEAKPEPAPASPPRKQSA